MGFSDQYYGGGGGGGLIWDILGWSGLMVKWGGGGGGWV